MYTYVQMRLYKVSEVIKVKNDTVLIERFVFRCVREGAIKWNEGWHLDDGLDFTDLQDGELFACARHVATKGQKRELEEFIGADDDDLSARDVAEGICMSFAEKNIAIEELEWSGHYGMYYYLYIYILCGVK